MSTPSSVVLFGAGASFGSGVVSPKPPPISSDLFPVLRRLFPTVWGGLSQEYLDELQKDFEAGMQRVGHERPHALPPLQRAMASFFFDFFPGDENLYRRIARKVKATNWDGAFISLNYDRLLELSLASEGVRPFVGTPLNSGTSVELCLPHGCCHIFCESVRGSAQGISFSGVGVATRGPVKPVGDRSEFIQRIKTDAFPPVMSYFDPLKLTTSGVNFIESQRARYDELIKGAKKAIVVGVRVRHHDTHLWSALAKTEAQIVYCSGRSSAQEFRRWAGESRSGKPSLALEGYFADLFGEICDNAGL